MKLLISFIGALFLSFLFTSCEKEFLVPTYTSTYNKTELMANQPVNNPYVYPATGIWQMGNTSFKLSIPDYPNTAASYCEGGMVYQGYFNWANFTFSLSFFDGNCNADLIIVLTENGGSITNAYYYITRNGTNCLPNASVNYVPTKVNTGC